MKYQVSCDMTFSAQADRDAIYSYLEAKRSLAFLLPGDSLSVENPVSGGYRVSCVLRMTEENDREQAFSFLQSNRGLVMDGTSGFVEKHTCRHEENEACTDRTVETWG